MRDKLLSKRLAAVADVVPNGVRLADIGSDHGHLPIALVRSGKIESAVCGEVIVGPYLQTVDQVEKYRLGEKITVRQADGLDAIDADDKISAITICGMGGKLICEILERGKKKLTPEMTLILQPNITEHGVRTWLMDHSYAIAAERLVEDNHKLYEIIVAKPCLNQVNLNEKEIEFGPRLMEERSALFLKKWQNQLRINREILVDYQHATLIDQEKIKAIEHHITLIEEVLHESH